MQHKNVHGLSPGNGTFVPPIFRDYLYTSNTFIPITLKTTCGFIEAYVDTLHSAKEIQEPQYKRTFPRKQSLL